MSKISVFVVVIACAVFSMAKATEYDRQREEALVARSELKDIRKKLAEVQDAHYLCREAMEQCCN